MREWTLVEAGELPGAGNMALDQGLLAGLRLLGIEAAVAEHPATRRPLDCFAATMGADLEVEGRSAAAPRSAGGGGSCSTAPFPLPIFVRRWPVW